MFHKKKKSGSDAILTFARVKLALAFRFKDKTLAVVNVVKVSSSEVFTSSFFLHVSKYLTAASFFTTYCLNMYFSEAWLTIHRNKQ